MKDFFDAIYIRLFGLADVPWMALGATAVAGVVIGWLMRGLSR